MKIVKLLRRAAKKDMERERVAIYDICVTDKSSHGKRVYEKLGSFNIRSGNFSINLFRLVF
jgi:hypothetical protein